jgi:chemotaxis protein methyltransferase CheR
VQAVAFTSLGKAYADLGQLAIAQQHCQQAVKLHTLLPEAHFMLALILQNQGQLTAAIEALKTTLYLNRNLPLAHLHLALLRKQQGQTEQAKLALNNVIRLLKRWPDGKIIPDSNGTIVKQLRETAEQMLKTL